MNTNNKLRRGGLVVLAMISMMVAIQAWAVAHVTGTFNVPTAIASVTNATVTSTAGTAVTLYPGQTLTITPSFSAAGAGTSNTTFGFDVSGDGVNFTTTTPITGTFAANGTNTVRGLIVVQNTNLLGIIAIRFGSLATTQTNAITVGTIGYSYDSLGL